MAYNSYYPAGYQPYQIQQGYQVPQQNAQQNASGLIWVQGEGAAKSYPVAPNTSVPLWDSEANIIYIKSADMSGMPSIKILDYTVRNSMPKSADIQPVQAFATKDDVDYLKSEIAALRAKFEGMGDMKETSNGK